MSCKCKRLTKQSNTSHSGHVIGRVVAIGSHVHVWWCDVVTGDDRKWFVCVSTERSNNNPGRDPSLVLWVITSKCGIYEAQVVYFSVQSCMSQGGSVGSHCWQPCIFTPWIKIRCCGKKNKKAEFRTQNHDCDEDPECSAKCQSTGISNSQSRRRWLHSSTPQTSPLELKTDQWGRAQTPIISAWCYLLLFLLTC